MLSSKVSESESELHLFEPHIQKKYLNIISGYKMWIGRPLLRPVWSLSQGPRRYSLDGSFDNFATTFLFWDGVVL